MYLCVSPVIVSNEFLNSLLITKLAIFKLVQKFLYSGSVQDVPHSGRLRMVTMAEMQDEVREIIKHALASKRCLPTCVPKGRSSVR